LFAAHMLEKGGAKEIFTKRIGEWPIGIKQRGPGSKRGFYEGHKADPCVAVFFLRERVGPSKGRDRKRKKKKCPIP